MFLIIIIILLITIILSVISLLALFKLNKFNNLNNKHNDFNKIKKFKKYLKDKLNLALQHEIKSNKNYKKSTRFGIGIHFNNLPGNLGPLSEWATYCSDTESDLCENNEPSFYFGSGTKPLTSIMVVSEIYKVWRNKYPNKTNKDFIKFYGGNINNYGAPPAVTYKQLFELTNGFEKSQFTETLTRNSNTQTPGTGNSYKKTLQEWLFSCNNKGLVKNKNGNGIYCDDSCDNFCPIPLDNNKYDNKCGKPFCPSDICTWAWKNPDGTNAEKDPDSSKFLYGEYCNCNIIKPNQFQNILQNLSIYNVSMMRSGIPDSDSIWGIDTSAQLSSRTHSIGPIQFVSEIIGFDWDPRWSIKKENFENNYTPNSLAVSGYLGLDKNFNSISYPLKSQMKPSKYPSAQYSSSGFTFLGILLWLLYDTDGKEKEWWEIDLNSLLPPRLYKLVNFAGTSGNKGDKYFATTNTSNTKYYSYEKTVSIGGVIHSDITEDSPIDINQTGIEVIKNNNMTIQSGVFKTKLMGSNKDIPFVDWDSTSGVSCGNAWGKCSDFAEIYMNMLSLNPRNPLLYDIQHDFINEFINYAGPNATKLHENRLRAPWCAGVNAWSQDYTYNCGVMGPDWFEFMITKNSYNNYGMIPCYGHLGSTYGYCSCNVYFPPGDIRPYPPYKNNNYYYSSPKWKHKFKFSEGMEFTICCAQNSCISESDGPIQKFINLVVKDPFNWND